MGRTRLARSGESAPFNPSGPIEVTLEWRSHHALDLFIGFKSGSKNAQVLTSGRYKGETTTGPGQDNVSVEERCAIRFGRRLRRARVEDMNKLDELVIGAMEHRAASLNIPSALLKQGLKITLKDRKGDTFVIPFAQDVQGCGAICVSIKRTFITHEITNLSEAVDWNQLRSRIPGAFMLSLRRKQEVYRGAQISLGEGPLHAMLSWNAAVELDLHIWWQLGGGRNAGRYLALPRAWRQGRVFFQKRGHRIKPPYVYLDLDESLDLAEMPSFRRKVQCAQFLRLEALDRVLLSAHVFGKPNANHGNYGTQLELVSNNAHLIIPIKDPEKGPWRVLATIDRQESGSVLRVLDESARHQPTLVPH